MDYIFASANPRIEPMYFAIAVIIALIAGAITERYRQEGRMSKVQSIAAVLLTAYIFLVLASTVFSRTTRECYSYELVPFWSYREILNGSKSLFWEDVFNVFMLFPMGLLLPITMTENGSFSKRIFRRVVFVGFLTSLTIESLQLILKCGLFEFDDMFHNTIGVAIGCWLYRKMRKSKK